MNVSRNNGTIERNAEQQFNHHDWYAPSKKGFRKAIPN